ncbi:MAG: amidohydrolase [Gammaproteobacteria bacterium]|nr:MAG: amidohydrolase [Gammaproteobacteria bacterium]
MKRRHFIGLTALATVGAAGTAAWKYWFDNGLFNQCYQGDLPAGLASHDVVRKAFDGIQADQLWDGHVHLLGEGVGNTGAWISPKLKSFQYPIRKVQYEFYRNAGCIVDSRHADADYTERLIHLLGQFPAGARLLLLAFDYFHDYQGRPDPAQSTFFTPNEYAEKLSRQHPQHFAWIASIHPYREDCVEALHRAVAGGARAVKWLPPAMGIDPASPRCDRFYEALARYKLPLLSHAGDEKAVHSEELQKLGNPLRLRRALDHGVRVIVAHLASLGEGIDLDMKGKSMRKMKNFHLFARLMGEPEYEGKLFGELSAVTQINRIGIALETMMRRDEWHHRIINASDYPLPAIPPLFSLKVIERLGWIRSNEAHVLGELRHWNPLLFDFVLKRTMRIDGQRLPVEMFHTRKHFDSKFI